METNSKAASDRRETMFPMWIYSSFGGGLWKKVLVKNEEEELRVLLAIDMGNGFGYMRGWPDLPTRFDCPEISLDVACQTTPVNLGGLQ